MSEEKALVIPEYNLDRNAGGPVAVVNMLKKQEKSEDYFTFIPKREINTDKQGVIKIKQLIEQQGLLTTIRRFLSSRLPNNSLKRFLNKRLEAKRFVNKHERKIDKHKKILCMKIYIAKEIIDRFPDKEITVVYQGQGSRYNEFLQLSESSPNRIAKELSDRVEREVYKNSEKVVFPSRGSIEALKDTNNYLEKILEDRDFYIINNSIDIQKLEIGNFPHSDKIKSPQITLTTISTCNKAKGVDRIPKKLGKLKDAGIDFQWILVSKGSDEQEQKIKEEIKNNNIYRDTVWFQKWFKREEILDLLSQSDFYIMMHRKSIFDLTTIEAMAMRNVPILSKIQGNEEFNIEDNVIYAEKLEKNISSMRDKEKIKDLKNLNKDISHEKFNGQRLLKDYKEVLSL